MNKTISFIAIFGLLSATVVFAQGANVSSNNLSDLFKAAAQNSQNGQTTPPSPNQDENVKSLQDIFANASKSQPAVVTPSVPPQNKTAISVNMPPESENDSDENTELENPPMPPPVEEQTKSPEVINKGTSLGTEAVAMLKPTTPDSKTEGKITFTETTEGLTILAEIKGAKPGNHGFHIHEFNLCDDSGKAAGSHWNPEGVKHGNMVVDGTNGAHAGDFNNITVDEKGNGKLEIFAKGLTLAENMKFSVLNKAVVIHEAEDDMSQPSGNAGSRISCGVIELKK